MKLYNRSKNLPEACIVFMDVDQMNYSAGKGGDPSLVLGAKHLQAALRRVRAQERRLKKILRKAFAPETSLEKYHAVVRPLFIAVHFRKIGSSGLSGVALPQSAQRPLRKAQKLIFSVISVAYPTESQRT